MFIEIDYRKMTWCIYVSEIQDVNLIIGKIFGTTLFSYSGGGGIPVVEHKSNIGF